MMAGADGWVIVVNDGDAHARHLASGLTLKAWGSAGVGVSLLSRDGDRIASCYNQREDGMPDAMASMLDPIIAALTAARAQVTQ